MKTLQPTQANLNHARSRAKNLNRRQVIYSYYYRGGRRIDVASACLEDYDKFNTFCGHILAVVYPDGEIVCR